MRFHFGRIPESPDFIPEWPWKPIKEPPTWTVQFLALPLGGIAAFIFLILWTKLTPLHNVRILPSLGSVVRVLLCFGAIIIVHELIHAVTHPMSGCSHRTILGFWPAGGAFFAHYDGELTRNRFVAVLLMPLAIISLGLFLIAAIFQIDSPLLAFISIINAFMACGDILGILLVLFQIPSSAIARNQGWRTYWREP